MHEAVHLVDRLEWLIGNPVREVFGRTTDYVHGMAGAEDGGAACLTFSNGAVASLFVSQSVYPLYERRGTDAMPGKCELFLHGTKGSLRYDTWRGLRIDGAQQAFVLNHEVRDEMSREIREFLDCIVQDREPSVGGAAGKRAVMVVQAIYESTRSGGPVTVS
jgi:UDP-N-acetyl-2-amino-2-deoxyglucuronate dehydrogenase